MTHAKRRALLYGISVVFGAGLLFAGFGITLPPDPGTQLSGARVLAQLGQTDEAIRLCDEVLKHDPDCVEAHLYRATFLAAAKRYEDALEAYGSALERADSADLKLNIRQDRAAIYLVTGDEAAFTQERAVIAAAGSDARVQLLDGMQAVQRKEWARAVKALEEAVRLSPDDQGAKGRLWNAYMERGRAALAGGLFGEAQQAFDAARALVPAAYDAHLQAAEVRLALDKPSEAVAIIREVGERTPGIAPLVFRASVGLLAAGDVEGALDAVDAAYVLDADGTRILLAKAPEWEPYRDRETVRIILEAVAKKDDDGLTPPN